MTERIHGAASSPATLRRREQDCGEESGHRKLYTGQNVRPAYCLHYDWTGWPTAGTMLPPQTDEVARATSTAWESDGLRLIEANANPRKVQLLFSASPEISPVFSCQRAKGRLQHALRRAGTPAEFSRKVSFRSLGENTSTIVANYVRGQVDKDDFADPRLRQIMHQFSVDCSDVDLALPTESSSGRYWYNLHLVLVAANRFRTTSPKTLGCIRDAAIAVSDENGCRLRSLSVMPEHVHLALRGNVQESPRSIAVLFQNCLAGAVGCRVWQDGYYVGTFSEYDVSVIRRICDQS